MGKYEKLLKAKIVPLKAGKPIAILHGDVARELGLIALERVEVTDPETGKTAIGIVDISDTFVKKNEIGLVGEIVKELNVKRGKELKVKPMPKPESVYYIKKKVLGETLSASEIKAIVNDINAGRLSELEAGAFITAVQIRDFTLNEIMAMTRALIESGNRIAFDVEPIVDKHSIGGINGRTTMVIVPIVAAAGLYIPKTSSRSITSAAGTADAMEVLANVCLSAERIKEITEHVGGVIAWGGALNLAPADEKIIKIEYPLMLNPQGQIIASVLAKKAAVGSKYLVLDIPIGRGAKIKSKDEAEVFASKFIYVAKKLGIKVEALLTDASRPCGAAFGPALEAKWALETLEGKRFDELAQKSCELAGSLLELAGVAKEGKGFEEAEKILKSGKALKKMKEIIRAQGAKVTKSEKIELAEHVFEVKAENAGEICSFDIKRLTEISRLAGAPYDKKAGLLLKVAFGEEIAKGQVLYEIYAENPRKLEIAKREALQDPGVYMEKIIIKKIE